MNLKGKMRISLPSGGRWDEQNAVSITVQDEASGLVFFSGEIGQAELAQCLVGNMESPISIELYGMDRLGCTRENKTEWVPRIDGYGHSERAKEARIALAPFEVDGWTARSGDYGNSHVFSRREGVEGYCVVFFRHVRPDGTPVL